ncbi:malectin-B-like [Paramacrobiotus metropolitanus]|uniref:malectin-B-like n=1 Tax=Paramacrobiotus metropolitanus TaxID=2943436 RepID=UPI002445E256|nr:malectin-B-like [Paramacrobiotus metropolitanus]
MLQASRRRPLAPCWLWGVLLAAVCLHRSTAQDPSSSPSPIPGPGVEEARRATGRKLDILYAINCGGEEHVDHFGVPYMSDPGRDGQASDYGLHWQTISNAHPDDFILYQTERYAEQTFGYDIPIPKTHKQTNFVLVLKFAEVYFNQPQMKVFDVLLNGEHLVVDGLDIFERAGGRAAAFDVHIPFRITGNKLLLTHTAEESDYSGTLRLDFVKTSQDNPKCNAFYVARGSLEDIPRYEPPARREEEEEEGAAPGGGERAPSEEEAEAEAWAWSAPQLDFPAPASPPAEEELPGGLGLDKYYPVIAVFLFIALLTACLFKL